MLCAMSVSQYVCVQNLIVCMIGLKYVSCDCLHDMCGDSVAVI